MSVLSLSQHPDGGYEIIRFATTTGQLVVGGFSRLFRRAPTDLGARRVFTYADRRYADAKGYLAAGFKLLGITPPGYRYWHNNVLYNRTKFQKHKLAQILPNYQPALTEAENMFANGYRRLWDAGHYRLEWAQ